MWLNEVIVHLFWDFHLICCNTGLFGGDVWPICYTRQTHVFSFKEFNDLIIVEYHLLPFIYFIIYDAWILTPYVTREATVKVCYQDDASVYVCHWLASMIQCFNMYMTYFADETSFIVAVSVLGTMLGLTLVFLSVCSARWCRTSGRNGSWAKGMWCWVVIGFRAICRYIFHIYLHTACVNIIIQTVHWWLISPAGPEIKHLSSSVLLVSAGLWSQTYCPI